MTVELPQSVWRTWGWRTERFRIVLLLAAAVLVYSDVFLNTFTFDDGLYIMGNPQVTAPSARAFFAPNRTSNVVRPLTFATFALNWALHGARPFGFLAVNVLLHAGVTLLLYFLLKAILEPEGASLAFAAACLFAVHPLHTEAVASIVGRSELLAAAFLLAAWLLHVRDREIGALICFALAVLSKESAVVFLPLVLVGDYAMGRWKPPARYVRIAGVTLLYLGLLWKVGGGHFGTSEVSLLDNPLARIPAGWRILNALRVAWKYVGLHIYPRTLSCDYSYNEIPVYLDWRHALPAMLATVAAVGAWIWTILRRKRAMVLAGGIYLAGFATTANIFIPTGTIMGERLAYLPSAGFCLLAALGLLWMNNHRRMLGWAVLGAIVAVFGARTLARNLDWRDDMSLYSAGVLASPNSAKMHANLGKQYMDHKQFDLARREFQAALRINPEYPNALAFYGLLEVWSGNYQRGGQMMEKALFMSTRSDPNYDFMAVSLAALYMQTGHTDGALDLLNREISESPGYARAWSNRAVIRYQRGEFASARADAETAARLDPGNAQAQNLLRLMHSSTQSIVNR